MTEDATERHNRLAPQLVIEMIKGANCNEGETLVVLESVVLGVLRFYRPDLREASVFLDTLTERVIERMAP